MTKPTYSREDVAKHNTESDLWIIIHNKVYDVTKFAKFHPGGLPILLRFGGKECTDEYIQYHNNHILAKYDNLYIGDIIPSQVISRKPKFQYAEPSWYNSGVETPYYTDNHRAFRDKVRAFVDKEIMPYCHEWDEKGTYPPELRQKAYDAGIYGAVWPAEYGGTPAKDHDYFYLLIFVDELSRCSAGGVLWSCFFSFSISLPPVLKVGSQYLKDKVARDVITGKKLMSLAVTEPSAGSDVGGLQTTAVRKVNAHGKEVFIVNGDKRYITGGVFGDYYTTTVKTDAGITLLLIERTMPGVMVRRQKTQGWLASNTAYIAFHNVEVPVENMIGEEGKGWLAVMHNFNQERFVLAAMSNRYSRMCLMDAVEFARARHTFGKALTEHQVIRHKIAEMSAKIELVHSYLEHLAFQMTRGRLDKIGGEIALVKVQATKTMEFCAREASQILGGCSYIRNGAGERIERLYREVRVNAIGGGSEEILLELGMKQAKL